MKNIHKAFENNWEHLLGHLNGDQRNAAGLALRKLRESLTNLGIRLNEYRIAQKELDNSAWNGKKEPQLTLSQEKLVNRLEAFHQQVYSTLSTIILVGNFLGINGKKDHPINSVERFLKYLKSNDKSNTTLNVTIDQLISSIIFRSKFIDHPQQNKLYNWMTFGYGEENFVIYFIPKGNEVYAIGKINPRDPNFSPPVNCSDFMVNPDGEMVYNSVISLVEYLFNFNFQEDL